MPGSRTVALQDDPAFAVERFQRGHHLGANPHDVEGSGKIDVDDATEVLERHGTHTSYKRDAGAIDHHPQRRHPLHRPTDVHVAGDSTFDEPRAQRAGDRRTVRSREVQDRHIRADRRQRSRGRPPQSGRPSGDQRVSIFETHELKPPRRRMRDRDS